MTPSKCVTRHFSRLAARRSLRRLEDLQAEARCPRPDGAQAELRELGLASDAKLKVVDIRHSPTRYRWAVESAPADLNYVRSIEGLSVEERRTTPPNQAVRRG
jgi:hypothetical protein